MEQESLHDFLLENTNHKLMNKEVYQWWESQRLKYNLISFSIGICSIFGIQAILKLPYNSIGIYIGIAFILAILGNLFYFIGWFIELFSNRNEKVGPILFSLGTIFTGIVLVAPFFLALYLPV